MRELARGLPRLRRSACFRKGEGKRMSLSSGYSNRCFPSRAARVTKPLSRFSREGAKALIVALLFVSLATCLAHGDDKPAAATDSATSATLESLRQKRQDVAGRIAGLEKSHDGSPDDVAKSDIESLQSLEAVYAQHQAQLEQRSQLEAHIQQAEKQVARLDEFDPDEPKPYSFLLLEQLRDQLAAEKDHESAIKSDTKAAKRLLEAAHGDLDDSTGDTKEVAKGDAKKVADDQSPPKAEAESSNVVLAQAKVALAEAQIETLKLRLELCQARQKLLKAKADAVEKDVKFSAEDRDKQLQRLADQEAELKRQRREAVTALQQIDAQKQTDLKTLADAKQAERDAIVEAWHATAEACQARIVVIDERVNRLADARRHWKHRYELVTGKVEPEKVVKWRDSVNDFLDQLEDASGALEHRIDSVRDEVTALERSPRAEDERLALGKRRGSSGCESCAKRARRVSLM